MIVGYRIRSFMADSPPVTNRSEFAGWTYAATFIPKLAGSG